MKILLAIFTFIHCAYSAKILGIFPTPSISHQVVFRALMKDLAARGHELLILTPDPYKTDNPNVTQIDLHSSYKVFHDAMNFVDVKNSNEDEATLYGYFFNSLMKIFDHQLSHPEVKKLIAEKEKFKFDVLIIEGLINYPMLGFGEIFDAPVIEITSMDNLAENHRWMGNEANPVIHPDISFPFQQRRLSFSERWKCLKYHLTQKFYSDSYFDVMNNLVEKHFPIKNPSLKMMRSRVALFMTNTHPALGFIRPILPNTIQLGFMHIEAPKPLQDGPLKTFLDKSEHGVIYMSFGSNVNSTDLDFNVKRMFLDVFKSFKYDFIWKYEADDLTDIPKNVMLQKWLPQADLLAHPKIKLFITHAGLQSTEETIDRAVPTIAIPFLGDQNSNAERIERLKIGVQFEIQTITEEKLKAAINEILKPEYKENVQKLRDLIYDEPMTTREKAVWWTEYVIRHKGAKHFDYHGKEVPFYEKHFLDFAALGSILTIVMAKVVLIVISKILSISSKKVKPE
ncbi:UDP-glycosyltransferase UGT5-like [Chironomus tepperi]|uniref:UDP-glycosyltransferase UGT5-like n=1 Tax=Chironomus tepperi TaxID=113505 RepID=UPI00391FADBC